MAVPSYRFRIESQETIRRAIERKNETIRQSIVNSENETLVRGAQAMDISESEPLMPGTESVGGNNSESTVHEDSTAMDIGGSDAATLGYPALGNSVPEQRQLREVYVVVSEVFTEYEGSKFEVEAVTSNLKDANCVVGMFAEEGYMGVSWDDPRWKSFRETKTDPHNGCASWILESPAGHGKCVRSVLRKVIPPGLIVDG